MGAFLLGIIIGCAVFALVRAGQLTGLKKDLAAAMGRATHFERMSADLGRRLQAAEREIRKALEKAESSFAKASDAQRIELEAKIHALQTAEEKNKRAISMAQQTKKGNVYVISNVGSFGEHVYKIGLTRRLDPLDRIRELGDASVPFEFDVHALIPADDAPALEHALHKVFVRNQMNEVSPKKEFFRVTLEEIRGEVAKMGIEPAWTIAAEARGGSRRRWRPRWSRGAWMGRSGRPRRSRRIWRWRRNELRLRSNFAPRDLSLEPKLLFRHTNLGRVTGTFSCHQQKEPRT